MSRMLQTINDLTLGNPQRVAGIVCWRVVDSMVSTLPSTIMLVATWFLIQPLVNPGTTVNVQALWLCVCALVAQVGLSFLTSRKIYVLTCAGAADAVYDERVAMGEKLRRLPLGYYYKNDAGALTSVLLHDYDTVENYGSEVLSQAALICARMVLAFVVLVCFDGWLAVATMVVVPLSIPFLVRGMSAVDASTTRLAQAGRKVASATLEYVGALVTLRAYGQAGTRFQTLRQSFLELRDASLDREAASRPIGVYGRAVVCSGAGILMLAVSARMMGHAVDPFVLMIFLLLSLTIYEPIVTLFYFLSAFGGARSAGMRIREVLDQPELEVRPNMDVARSEQLGISFSNVGFSYEDKSNNTADCEEALHDVVLNIPVGSMTALVGPSGSGKSTLCRLIARFWDPSSGCVRYEGKDLRSMSADEVLSRVSIVFQDVYLFQDSVANNIRMGREGASDEEVREAARRASALGFIEALPQGFKTQVGEGGCTLSGGERQRVSIARALLKDAPIVLLDEATSSLDAVNEVEVQQAVSELVQGRTVVVIAHRLQSVRDASQIVVLREGGIEAVGTHEELLRVSETYRNMWLEQERAEGWRIR